VPILEHYQDRGQTVNSAWYYGKLEEEFKAAPFAINAEER